MTAILALLGDGNTTVRKWAISAISALAPALGDANLETLVTTLLGGLDRKKGSKGGVTADPRTLIQTIGSVSRQVGYRLGRHLARIIPLFLDWLGDPSETSPERDEQRENCLQVGVTACVEGCARVQVRRSPFVWSLTLLRRRSSPSCCGHPRR